MKKTRILFDNLYLTRGGVEVFMNTLIAWLPRDRYDITVAAVHWDKNDPNDRVPEGVRFIRRYHRRKHYKRYSLRWFLDTGFGRVYDALVSLYLSLLNFDLVIAAQEKQTMRRADALRAKRKIAWVHTDYTTRLNNWKASFPSPEAERACMARFEKVVCVSETVRQGLIQAIGDPGNLVVCYNPIDVRRILRLSEEPCPLQRDPMRPLLVSVGRLVAEKQYLVLLQAVKALRESLDFELWIIGDGEERPMLERYIAENGLTNVRLLGTQANPFTYLREADLFVSSSQTEGYGLTVQEALVLGVPVVAVACPGVAESLDTRFGILTENSPSALADGIRSMLEPETLADYRARIAAEYPRDALYKKRLEAIGALLEK